MTHSLTDLSAKMSAVQVTYVESLVMKLEAMTTEMQAVHVTGDNVQNLDWMAKNVPLPGQEKILAHLPVDKIIDYLKMRQWTVSDLKEKFSSGGFQTVLLHIYKEMEGLSKSNNTATYDEMKQLLEKFTLPFYYHEPVDANIWALGMSIELPQTSFSVLKTFYIEKLVTTTTFDVLPLPSIPQEISRWVPSMDPNHRIFIDVHRRTKSDPLDYRSDSMKFMRLLLAMTNAYNKDQYQVVFAFGIQLLCNQNYLTLPDVQRYYLYVLGMFAVAVAVLSRISKSVVHQILERMKSYVRQDFVSDQLDELLFKQRVFGVWCNFKQERECHFEIISKCPTLSKFYLHSHDAHVNCQRVFINSCMASAWLLKSVNVQAEMNMIKLGRIAVGRLQSLTHNFISKTDDVRHQMRLKIELEVLELYSIAFEALHTGTLYEQVFGIKSVCRRLAKSDHFLNSFCSFCLNHEETATMRQKWDAFMTDIRSESRNVDFNVIPFFSFTNFLFLVIIMEEIELSEEMLQTAIGSWIRQGAGKNPDLLGLAQNCLLKLQGNGNYSGPPTRETKPSPSQYDHGQNLDIMKLIRWEEGFAQLMRFGIDSAVVNEVVN